MYMSFPKLGCIQVVDFIYDVYNRGMKVAFGLVFQRS